MLEFSTVSREIRSLIHRRRHLMTFLGSLFVATGLFLHNVLKGDIPRDFVAVREYIFAFYAIMLMVPTLILALRMARLHGGLVLNGVLYAHLMQQQDFTRKPSVQRAARHNFFSVSFLQFLLADLIAGFSATILGLSVDLSPFLAIGCGVGVAVLWLGLYFRFHHKAVQFAMHKIGEDSGAPFDRKEWQNHVSTSLEDANTGLLSEIGFVGLIMFSMFEKLSSVTKITRESAGPAYDDIQRYAPWVYNALMLITCVFGLLVYLRVRVAIGSFSLQLDPTDRPFRPLRLTDSLLGYMLLAFLFAVALHMVLLVPLQHNKPLLFGISGGAFLLAVVIEQLTLVVTGSMYRRQK
jgi:hypothetical protein